MQYLVVASPLPVQVTTRKRASVVAMYDSIRVEHGYYLKDKGFTEQVGLCCVRNQEIYHALYGI